MATKEEQVQNLFGKLETHIRNKQTKRALKTCDELLKLSPGDEDAVSCKVALLIDHGDADDALKLIEAHPALAPSLAFERSYCAYRQGRLQESLSLLQSVEADRAADRLQLEAQVQYRLGNYPEAISLYSRLFQEHQVENLELQTNVVAAYAMGGRAGEVNAVLSAMRVSARDSFELAFNVACGMIEQGDLDAADEQLQLAYRVGEETLYDEELDEDEVAGELAPISAQHAYLAARRGMFEEAVAGLQNALEIDSAETAAGAAAAVDVVACMLRLHPGDRKTAVEGLKTLEPCVERSGGFLKVKPSLEGRLGAAHCEALLTGYATAALVANKSDIAREAVRSLEKQYKGAAGVLLLQAALMARDGKVKEASALLESAAAATGAGAPLGPQLMRAQLAAQAGDAQAAAAVLASLPAAQAGRPAVLATRVALLEQAGNSEAAAAVLESALKTSNDGAAQRWALRHLARLDVERGAYDAAADRLQRLIELSPEEVEDPELLSLLPRLVAVSKPDAARALAAKLPAPPQLPAATVDGLESSGALAGAATRRAEDAQAAVAVPGSKRKSDIDGAEKKEKRKRRRKKRYPKGFDPANPGPLPDPERWLPKWQRADAKKARKKRKDKDMVKGSQGAGKVDSSLDKSGPAAAPAAASAPAKPSGKKKGKGKR